MRTLLALTLMCAPVLSATFWSQSFPAAANSEVNPCVCAFSNAHPYSVRCVLVCSCREWHNVCAHALEYCLCVLCVYAAPLNHWPIHMRCMCLCLSADVVYSSGSKQQPASHYACPFIGKCSYRYVAWASTSILSAFATIVCSHSNQVIQLVSVVECTLVLPYAEMFRSWEIQHQCWYITSLACAARPNLPQSRICDIVLS